MSRQLRRYAAVFSALLLAVLANLTWVQVLDADNLRQQQGNTRVLLEQFNRSRGSILVGSEPIASSARAAGENFYQRSYANGPLYAPITGFYSLLYGATGIERSANDILSGTDSRFFVDRIQQLFAGRRAAGGSVRLTIDKAAQQAAFKGLGDRAGAVVAIDPKTGAILAMVSTPSYDPQQLAPNDPTSVRTAYETLLNDPAEPMLNRAIARNYPPGSTFKLITAAAAIASGKFTPDSVIPGPATYQLPNSRKLLRNWQGGACAPGGKLTLQRALEVSCNTAFAWLGNQLGADELRSMAERFGFEHSFVVPMVAAAGKFPSDPDAAQTAMSAIGQFDVGASALQMALVSAGIANNGVLMLPYLIKDVRGPDLSVIDRTTPTEYSNPLSAADAKMLADMMVSVVQRGTGSNGRIGGVRVGGKTGTAETGTDAKPHAWFTAFAPGVAVAVVIENGGGASEVSGNALAAPIANAVIRAVLANS